MTAILCQSCQKEKGEELHTCPYAEEFLSEEYGDDCSLCNCCADCEKQCAWDI